VFFAFFLWPLPAVVRHMFVCICIASMILCDLIMHFNVFISCLRLERPDADLQHRQPFRIARMMYCLRRDTVRPLQNAPFCPNPASPMGGIYASLRQAQILILKILNVWMPVPMGFSSGWLKFSPSLALNKIEHFSKVSQYR